MEVGCNVHHPHGIPTHATLNSSRHFETMGILMQEEGGIMDYEEGIEAKTDEELWWLSSLVQLDFG
jgi:hypothetical protein